VEGLYLRGDARTKVRSPLDVAIVGLFLDDRQIRYPLKDWITARDDLIPE
jgi:hypothetical protein